MGGKTLKIKSKHISDSSPRYCPCCGTEFLTRNPRRLYCCERCRRDWQNERRAHERAERRELGRPVFDDPWERDDWEIMGNALLDAAPVFEDSPWCGPSVKIVKPVRKKKEKNPGWLWLPGVPQ